MTDSVFLQAFIYLAAAVFVVPVARRLGLGSALGYLLAGVLIGPYVLGLVGKEGQDVMHFAEFGVVLMLFLVGLELEPRILWRMRTSVLGLGGSQVAVTALVIGLIAFSFGLEWQTALAIGLTLSLSSTAIVLQTLEEKGWLKTQAGKRGFSVLLFQDVAVIPILAILPFLALPNLGVSPGEGGLSVHGPTEDRTVWMETALVLGVVTGIVLAGRYLTRPLFHWIARTRAHEVFIATALLLVVGITLAMNFVGLSPALGTFLAGVVLAESEYRHELESDIEPFKGLLLGLFFLAVGASINFSLIADSTLLVLGLVAILIVTKFGVLLFLGRVFGLRLADNLMFAVMLAQGGEFAFLLFSYATESRVLERDLANLLVVVVVLSMMITPLLIITYERWLRPRFQDCVSPPEDTTIEDDDNPVIIAGYGRFGQIVQRMLSAGRISSTLLDHDAGQIELTGRFGNKVFYGDASRRELLEAAGATRAKLLVVAIDNRDKAVEMVRVARQHFPQLKVLARAYDRPHAYRLMEAGADEISRETFGSALIMGEAAYKALGYDDAQAYRIMRTFRRHDEEGIEKLFEVWGDDHHYGVQIRQHLDELKKVLEDDSEMAEDHFKEAWRVLRDAEAK
jgi:monovalent cation:proton antiporter-2 (CPA2) family protein